MRCKIQGKRLPCPIGGCKAARRKDYVMCPRHWYQVPMEIRREVQETFKAARGSAEHRQALVAAIRSVEDGGNDG